MKLSIIIPIYNEEENLPELYRRLKAVAGGTEYAWETIFVNDGSRDRSLEILKDLAKTESTVKIISFSRNFGHQAAISAGIDHAGGDAVVVMDGDLQDPPELIPDLSAKWREGFEVVYAQRETREKESRLKILFAFCFYRLIKRITKIDIPVDAGDFRLLDRRVADALKRLPEKQRFLRGLVAWTGFRQVGVKFKRPERFAGEPKYSFRKSLDLALVGITSFSFVPLRLATYLGFLIAGLSFVYALYIIYLKFYTDQVIQGWTSLMVAVLFLGGIQLITLGILGEYVGRISEELKQRPSYIIKEKINF
jgi:polyisoprenyl-phosphate glycosyltransferase